jgi:hypothetical protein
MFDFVVNFNLNLDFIFKSGTIYQMTSLNSRRLIGGPFTASWG